ncbi:MAG TPA: c-type cytochrome, partial [Flavisolibacter sp.]|nr:c-type cytochrome [Flavisolibacter sp.]
RYLKIIIGCLILLSCNSTKNASVLKPSNLKSYFIRVDHLRDNLFKTPKGAFIRIKKGTFSEDQELEIKEAYSLKDMVLAGLTTSSDGRPLKSGGMIFINTKDGSKPEMKLPISIVIPSFNVDKDMQLFKGELQKDSSINWDKVDSVIPIKDNAISSGMVLFQQNCATCHALDKVIQGPALRGVESRDPWTNRKELESFIKNPSRYIPKSRYTLDLFQKYRQIMPSAILTNTEIDKILDYIKEAKDSDIQSDTLSQDSNMILISDSTDVENSRPCNDTVWYNEKDTGIISNSTIQQVFNDTITELVDSVTEVAEDTTSSFNAQFVPGAGQNTEISNSGYEFDINSLGWYNVDALVIGLPNTTLCQISVQLKQSDINAIIKVYIFFPGRKTLITGYGNQKGKFDFGHYNNKLLLYLGEPAFVLGFGNKDETFYYGTSNFKVKAEQNILLNIKPSTQEELLEAVKRANLEGINMDVIKLKSKIVPCNGNTPKIDSILK